MVKINSEILLKGVLFAASNMQQLTRESGSPNHLQLVLFVPLPFPGLGSAPVMSRLKMSATNAFCAINDPVTLTDNIRLISLLTSICFVAEIPLKRERCR